MRKRTILLILLIVSVRLPVWHTERIRVDGQRLTYKHEITGPGDKHDEHEVVFDLPIK